MVPSATGKGEPLFVTHLMTMSHVVLGIILSSILLVSWQVGLGGPGTTLAEESVIIADSADYFPDAIGNRWVYRGQITEEPIQTVDNKFFTNVSTVVGTKMLNAVQVTVFHDTNSGNHGPSESYYRRDPAGIVYYGSDPGTPLEKQLTPYQIFRFPLTIPSSFQQFDRTGLDYGTDMDHDGTSEKVDAKGWVTILGRDTVTVPAGTFEVIKVEARMTMQVHLSSGRRTIVGLDTMTAWFAKGVGLVKYVERQEMGLMKDDRGVVVEITEELEEYEIQTPRSSLDGVESPAESIFAHDAGNHELRQVVLSSRFSSNP
ncbi:MAG: hypothetical protein NNA18_03530 [Nitrospira sp.]|nr:hypothetical protein [Nitrospira sp.]